MARRRKTTTPGQPFDDAFAVIRKMEECVCYRTVTTGYNTSDVCEWLWPPYIVDALRGAFPYIRNLDKSEARDELLLVPDRGATTIRFNFVLRVQDAHMCAPEHGYARIQETPMAPTIEASIRGVAEVHRKFEQVRKVVTWLNDNASVGAAAYYFPSLRSLLPARHPLQEAKGELYREPKRPLAEIASDMREAMTTIAMGLLSYDGAYTHEASNFKVDICHDDGTSSQTFCLI